MGRRGSPAARSINREYAMKTKSSKLTLATAVLLAVGVTALRAQTYSINWNAIAGGGGTSTNGPFALSGTIAQAVAGGPMTGGNYSLTSGFWSLISAVQTSGAPPLYISHAGNSVTVSWEAVSGWTLHQNGSLTLPANWTVSGGVTTSNGTNYFNLTSPTGKMFFRLSNP